MDDVRKFKDQVVVFEAMEVDLKVTKVKVLELEKEIVDVPDRISWVVSKALEGFKTSTNKEKESEDKAINFLFKERKKTKKKSFIKTFKFKV